MAKAILNRLDLVEQSLADLDVIIEDHCAPWAHQTELLQTIPGESGPLCTFETTTGDIFTLPKPPITTEQEAALLEQLKDILDDEEF